MAKILTIEEAEKLGSFRKYSNGDYSYLTKNEDEYDKKEKKF